MAAPIQDLCNRLVAEVNDYNTTGQYGSRMAIVSTIQDILYQACPPTELWLHQASIFATLSATRVFLDWQAFDMIPRDGTISYQELAKKLNGDIVLIERIGGTLVANQMLRQVGDDQLAHTPRSLPFLETDTYRDYIKMLYDETFVPFIALPEYFRTYGIKEPQGPVHSPHSFAYRQPEKSCWDIMHETPERMRVFMSSMKVIGDQLPRTGIYDYTWVKNELNKDTKRPLLVDVGGGKGQAVQGILEENPWLPTERIVVQDRPDVAEEATTLDSPDLRGVTFQGHDFNKAQPVKGALIYHIRRCLHDYGDDICIGILRQIADAMSSDSRCLIVEQVIGNPPTHREAHLDYTMLGIGGKERKRTDFERLAAASGLKINKIHQGPHVPIAVVECFKA